LEPGESPEACMLREIQEETGEALTTIKWLADFNVPIEDEAFALLHLYLGEIDKPASDLLVGEGLEHRFFAVEDLGRVEVVPGTKAVLLAYAESLNSAPGAPVLPAMDGPSTAGPFSR